MPKKNKSIEGFMVLLKLGGIKEAKKFVTGENETILYNPDIPLHNFLITVVANKYRTMEVKEKVAESFGLIVDDKQSKEVEDICRKVIFRASIKYLFDSLNCSKRQAMFRRRALFIKMAKREVKNRGYKWIKFMGNTKASTIVVAKNRTGTKRFKVTAKNGFINCIEGGKNV